MPGKCWDTKQPQFSHTLDLEKEKCNMFQRDKLHSAKVHGLERCGCQDARNVSFFSCQANEKTENEHKSLADVVIETFTKEDTKQLRGNVTKTKLHRNVWHSVYPEKSFRSLCASLCPVQGSSKKKCVCFSYICVHELNLPRQLIVTRLSNDLIESYHPIANPLWCLSIPFYILDNFASLYLISFYFDIICSVIFDLESLIFLIGWFVGRRVRLFVLLFNHLGFRFLLSCCSDPFFYICSRENEKKNLLIGFNCWQKTWNHLLHATAHWITKQ